MARRKDHSPKELKEAIRAAAEKIIYTKGIRGLTARALAVKIGYTPGTIYNFFHDMDALVTEVNSATLKRLYNHCLEKLKAARPGHESIKSLAYAYIDFAHAHERAWHALFNEAKRTAQPAKVPAHYQQCVTDLFGLIETTMQKNLNMTADEAAHAARLLWACLHGITSLMLDGRLSFIGIKQPHAIVDDLLRKYLKDYAKG